MNNLSCIYRVTRGSALADQIDDFYQRFAESRKARLDAVLSVGASEWLDGSHGVIAVKFDGVPPEPFAKKEHRDDPKGYFRPARTLAGAELRAKFENKKPSWYDFSEVISGVGWTSVGTTGGRLVYRSITADIFETARGRVRFLVVPIPNEVSKRFIPKKRWATEVTVGEYLRFVAKEEAEEAK